jgi:hypothetical protein
MTVRQVVGEGAFRPKTGIGEQRPRQIIRHQQRWRPLSAQLPDPRRSLCAWARSRQARSKKPVAWEMRQRRHPNIVTVALATKVARIAWSLLTSDCGTRAQAPSRHAHSARTRFRRRHGLEGPSRGRCGRVAVRIAIGLRAPVRSRDRRHERVHASRRGSRATFPITSLSKIRRGRPARATCCAISLRDQGRALYGERLAGGKAFAVDDSILVSDARRCGRVVKVGDWI